MRRIVSVFLILLLLTGCREKAGNIEIVEYEELIGKNSINNSLSEVSRVIDYDLHEAIAVQLDPVRFDKEFVKYLRSHSLIPIHDGSIKYAHVRDDGYLEFDFNENCVRFTLILDGYDTDNILCTVHGDEYLFE